MYLLIHNFLSKKHNLLTVMSLLLSMITFSQNVSSPYSIIGIGDIETSYFNRTSGMANTGIAYRNNKYIILNNPASLSDFQSQLFLVELSGRGKFVNFTGSDITPNTNGKDFSIERLSLGVRINKWWGTSVGLMPFSTSNYSFSGTTSLQGTSTTLPVEYDGSGGINRFYFANGFRITKNLSVGINTSFLGGSLAQQDTLESADLTTGIFTKRNIYVRNWYFDYGIQYHIPVSKKWDLTIGATYANRADLRAQSSALVMDEKGDTLSNKILPNNFFTLPNSTGVGLAITKDKRVTFLADYRFQDWSSLNIKGQNYSLINSSRYSAGMEYSKLKQYLGVPYEVFDLQAGAFYDKSYLKIGNEQIADRGFTLGVGLNSKRSTLSYHLSAEFGTRGSQYTPVRESYASFTIGFSYKDFWYTKGRKYE
jgi:hypothetical protein